MSPAKKAASPPAPSRATGRKARPKASQRARKVDLEGIDVSLDHLLSNLGPGAIQLLVAPKGLAVTVGDPVIVDPMDTTSGIERDAIVLAIGISPDSSLARTLISTAGRVGATAVAFKLMGRQCEWLPEAEKAGVALLTVADEMSWTHLYRLLALTLPSLRQSAPVAGMASVPLGDLFALANAVGALVGGAVTIEDKSARVLAYSTLPGQPIDEARQQTILGREVPDTAEMKALYQRLSQTEGVIRIEEIPDLSLKMWPRIAAPVRVGKETLGSIWALEGDSPLGRDAERALIEAARVAALHLIHARSSRDVERRTRGDLLRSLLEGRGDVNSTLTRLGLERRSPLVVMAFELSGADPTEEDLYRERVVDLVATYSEAYRLKGACVAIGRTVYALLPVSLKGSVQELAEHDEQKNTAYLETLRAYLDAFGDIPTAAASVNVHPNTFRYRLRRLLELFSLDISDPDQRLVIELQLRLIQGHRPADT
ncbi:MAG: helix-turn-helix domain-containing protein [Actinobacteria bacterium]|nr:helix-turn-helix domain-containing protein [Actinomycetota bacterium]